MTDQQVLPKPAAEKTNGPRDLFREALEQGKESLNSAFQLASSTVNKAVEQIQNSIRSGQVIRPGNASKYDPEAIKDVQEGINKWLEATGQQKIEVNGRYDKATVQAVMAFQAAHAIDVNTGALIKSDPPRTGLVVDGALGPRTMRALDLYLGRSTKSFEEFKVITNGLWDISQVREEEQGRASDGGWDTFGQPEPWNGPGTSPVRNQNVSLKGRNTLTREEALSMVPNKAMHALGDAAIDRAGGVHGSSGLCLGGVMDAASKAARKTGNSGLAIRENWFGRDWAIDTPKILEKTGAYAEVTGVTLADVQHLPKGAVVVYEKPGRGQGAPGHIQVAGGDGKFYSDFEHGSFVYRGVDRVRVFIPKGDG